MNQEPGKKKPSFRERCRAAFNGISKRDLVNVFRETAKDLRRPQEIALLVGCTLLPGGWIGYGVYRVAKYRHQKTANDNKSPPDGKTPPPQSKSPGPPRP